MQTIQVIRRAAWAVLFIGIPVVGQAATDLNCGGIAGGQVSKSQEWAHYIYNDEDATETITISPDNYIDKDPCRPGAETCGTQNRWNAGATTYRANWGECKPTSGILTRWKPDAHNDTGQVTVTLRDYTGPFDDDDVTVIVPVKAYSVKVVMNVVNNNVDMGGPVTKEMWEGDVSPPRRIQWTNHGDMRNT